MKFIANRTFLNLAGISQLVQEHEQRNDRPLKRIVSSLVCAVFVGSQILMPLQAWAGYNFGLGNKATAMTPAAAPAPVPKQHNTYAAAIAARNAARLNPTPVSTTTPNPGFVRTPGANFVPHHVFPDGTPIPGFRSRSTSDLVLQQLGNAAAGGPRTWANWRNNNQENATGSEATSASMAAARASARAAFLASRSSSGNGSGFTYVPSFKQGSLNQIQVGARVYPHISVQADGSQAAGHNWNFTRPTLNVVQAAPISARTDHAAWKVQQWQMNQQSVLTRHGYSLQQNIQMGGYRNGSNGPITLAINPTLDPTLPTGFSLNLNSRQANLTSNLTQAVQIRVGGYVDGNGNVVGGRLETINAGQSLTAAQYTAAAEVSQTGNQSIVLSERGTAVYGYLNLSSTNVSSLSSLSSSRGVQINLIGYTSTTPLVVSGAARITSNVYLNQTTANTTSVLNVGSLTVGRSGSLSGLLNPNSTGLSGLYASSGLTLNVLGNVLNQGTITSPGLLAINAGGSISNVSVGTGVSTIIAPRVNLFSGTGNYTNSGVISATRGNLNINAAPQASTSASPWSQIGAGAAPNVTFNNANGVLKALNGNINFRDNSFTNVNASKINIALTGGDLSAKNINFYSDNGDVSTNVNSMNTTGMVNVNAGTAHMQVQTGNLSLGTQDLTGDPTFYNFGGSVTVNSSLSFGTSLAILSSQDVIFGAGSSVNNNGGSVLVMAGVMANPIPGNNPVLTGGAGDTTTTVHLTGASATGGQINLNGASAFSSSGAHGGDITLVAMAGSGANSGTIVAPNTLTITSGGTGAGANGNVRVYGGATSGNAVNIGGVNTTGGTGGGGAIDIQTVTSNGINGLSITNGAITGGSISAGTLQTASIQTGNLTAPGAAVTVKAGVNVLTRNITSNGLGSNTGGTITVSSNSNNTLVVGPSAVLNGVNGTITANGGPAAGGGGGTINLTNSGGGGVTVQNLSNLANAAGAAGGAGGNTILNAGTGTLNLGSGTINNSASGAGNYNGGNTTLSGSGLTVVGGTLAISGNATGTGNGGNVSITTTGTTSDITLGAASNNISSISVAGGSAASSAGDGGSISLTAGRNLTVGATSTLNVSPQGTNGKGGTVNLTASNNSTSGLLTSNHALTANGAGTSNGGTVALTQNSSATMAVNADIAANLGTSANFVTGAGITLTNTGAGGSNGGITIASGVNLSVNATANANGGPITINAGGSTPGFITFGGGGSTLSTRGGSNGGNVSGAIKITASGVGVTAGVENLSTANAHGGSGGTITLTTLGGVGIGNVTVGTSSSGLNFDASSVFSNGGTVNISAGGNLTVPVGAMINVIAGRNTSTSGTINLTASTAATNGVLTDNGVLSANGTNVGGAGISNGGTITLTQNSSATMVINANITANGTTLGTTGNGGTITLTNTGAGGLNGGIAITSAVNLAANGSTGSTGGSGGAITINAGGSTPGFVTFGGGGSMITSNGIGTAGGATVNNGGTVSVTAAGVSVTSGLATLSANAASSGNGGTVSLTTKSGVGLGDITVGTTSGLSFSATGGSAGSAGGSGGVVNISSGHDLTVPGSGTAIAVNALGNVGNGGTLNLTASTASTDGVLTYSARATTDVNLKGAAIGNGGKVTLTSNSQNAIVLNSGGGTTVFDVSGGTTSGNGGSITVTNLGAGGSNGGISFVTGAVNWFANATNGNGGTIVLNAGGATPGLIVSGGGGSPSMQANGGGSAGNGGSISITAGTVSFSGLAGSQQLTANGAGTGNGGSLSITTLGATGDIAVAPGAGGLIMSATGGSAGSAAGNGGTITLSAGRNLSIASGGTFTVAALGTNGNGGTIALTASSAAANGTLTVNSALNADGVGNGTSGGNGGTITLTQNSSSTMQVNGTLSANTSVGSLPGTGYAQKGGTITITNIGNGVSNGGITLGAGVDLLAEGGGNLGLGGGNITINAGGTTPGVITLPGNGASINASQVLGGSGGPGGNIFITGSKVLITGAGVETLNARGNGQGAGGTVTLIATAADADLTIGNGTSQFAIFANPVTNANATGGTITVSAGRNLTVGSAIAFNPSGPVNAQGGVLNLTAGSAGAGKLQVSTGLNASGLGTGKGGTINITYNDSTNALVVGGTGANSFINGNITANAGASGAIGGTITIANAANGQLNVSLLGNISAAGGTNLGTINFNPASGQAIGVVGLGSLTGIVNAVGTSVNIAPGAAGEVLTTGTITGTTGSVTLTANGAGGSVVVPSASVVSTSTTGSTVTIASNTGGVSVSGKVLANVNGAKAGTINISTTGNIGLNGATLQAQSSGSGAFNGGAVNISGATFSATGTNLLSANANSTLGNGGTVSITTTGATGDLTADNTLTLTAQGGTVGGNGGNVTLSAGHDLTLASTGSINVSPQGTNGNGGTINLTASTNSNSGLLVDNMALNANGVGTGGGGTINLVQNSNQTLTLNAGMSANGIHGGTITITNLGAGGSNGGIKTVVGTLITADGSNGSGGTVTINAGGATPGLLTLGGGGGGFYARGGGSGVANGGVISATGSGVVVTSGAGFSENFVASAAGTGNGGTINLTTLSGTSIGDITVGTNTSGGLAFIATGGSTGSARGNGGVVNISSGHSLTVPGIGTSIAVNALGNVGNGGTLNLTASTASTDGVLTYSARATTDVNLRGAAIGNGGNVTLTSNSQNAIVLNSGGGTTVFDVSGGTTSGNGGSITVTNLGAGGSNGGISFAGGAVNWFANATNGNGGTITLNAGGATPGLIVSGGGGSPSMQANGGGSAGNGGSISITAGTVSFSGLTGSQQLTANGAGTGNGGSLSITTVGATGDIAVASGAGGLILSATGGSAGSAAGNGGKITLSAGRNLSIASNAILTVNALGTNGNGGKINLASATAAAAGTMQVDQTLRADGAGTGNGGVINITYKDASNALVVGGTGANSYISGDITANAPGSGTGGTITIANAANGPLNVSLLGNISAAGTNLGTINFNPTSGQAINVGGPGSLTGIVNAVGTSVVISPGAAGEVLTTGTITGTTGSVTLTANGAGGSVVVPSASVVSTSTTGSTVTINSGTGGVSIRGKVLANVNGAKAGTININTTGNIGLNGATIEAQSSGSGAFNGGVITLTGATFSAIGANTLSANANSTLGNGGSISIATTGATGDLTADNTLTINARGGTTSGNGGTISLTAGRNLIVEATGTLNVSPQGTNGNGGTISLTASTNSTSGLLTNNVVLNANGAGNGDGGKIILTQNSTQQLVISKGISANGGATGGNGGTVTITNTGAGGSNGGIKTNSPINITADASNGSGGTITLNAGGATPGLLTLGGSGGGFYARGGGSGVANGGTVSLTGSGIVVSSGAGFNEYFVVRAAGTGNGGTINLTTLSGNSTGDITVGTNTSGGLTFIATGGSAGSAGGNGGTVNISSGHDLTVPGSGTAIAVNALGNVGNGGTLNLTASTASTDGVLTYSARATTDVNLRGAAIGNGGKVTLTSNSQNAIVLNSGGGTTLFDVSGGTTSGNGGSITVTNLGAGGSNGGISFADGAVNWFANATNGNGGTIVLNAGGATPGLIVSGGGGSPSMQANGGGSAGNGGSISITAGTVSFSSLAGNQQLQANGAGTGNGGSLSITTLGATGDIAVAPGAGGLILSATGGSAGSVAGNGGTITLSAGRNLSIASGITPGGIFTILTVAALGTNGNGGTINLTSATAAAAGTMQVDQTLRADGAGTGNGGVINIKYKDASQPFVIGATGANSYISGDITANAPGSGTGGTITIANAANGPLNVDLEGNISASGTNLGTINFNPISGQAISVVGPGRLTGIVNAVGTSVVISPGAAGEVLTTGTITGTTGSVILTANGAGGSVVVPSASVVSTSTTGSTVTINSGSGGVSVSGKVLANVNGGNAGTINITTAGNVGLNGATIEAQSSGSGAFNGGVITLTGATFSAIGTNLLSANANSTLGNGGSVSITTTSATGDLTANNTLTLTAEGGTVGGNGGSVTLSSGHNLTLASTGIINVSPQGTNGNGGSVILSASTASPDGALVDNLAIDVSGKGKGIYGGNGGFVSLTQNSSATMQVNADITANSSVGSLPGFTSQKGGTIILTNLGNGTSNGGITLGAGVDLLAEGGGNLGLGGGNITINAGGTTPGVITLPGNGASINASQVLGGSGGPGGNIFITGSKVLITGAGVETLNARGNGQGAGGTVTLIATAADADLTIGNGTSQFAIFANPVTNANATGGTITVSAGRNLTVGSAIAFNPSGPVNAQGGVLNLTAGSAGPGNLQVNISLNASGIGSGNGGTINLTYNDPTNAIVVGGTGANSFINGNITANAGATAANGGTITITNLGAGTLNVALNGNISAAGGTNLGTINFNPASGQAISVVGPGSLTGIVNAIGTAVVIHPGAAGEVLTTGTITATTGTVTLTADGAGAQVVVPVISAVTGQTGVNINTEKLTNKGAITANTGDVLIASQTASNDLTVILGSGSTIIATAGNVFFNSVFAPGPITMNSGLGTITAGTGVIGFDGSGTGDVAIDVLALNGIITGTGNNISIKVESGNLVADGIYGNGSINLDASATAAGTLTMIGNVEAGGALTLSSGSAGSITIEQGFTGLTVFGTTATITTPNLTLENGTVITATAGDLTIASNAAGNALTINLGVGSTLTSSNNVIINTAAHPGQITMLSGTGNIFANAGAGILFLNGGTSPVSLNLTEINAACIEVTGSAISIQTQTGNLNFCLPLDTSSATGSGGAITISASGGAITLNDITTNGSGAGNSAGNVTLAASGGISFGNINANGLNNANGGTVSLSSGGQAITGGYISVTGNGLGNAGNITSGSGTFKLTGVDASGNSLDANGGVNGNGGNITITTTDTTQVFVVGSPIGNNGIVGNISASGVNGGFIILNNFGGVLENDGASITANGTTGNGGKILFQSSLPAGARPLIATINGTVTATNNAGTTGRIGFNGGPQGDISLLGHGTLFAADFVRIGNLDPITLDLLSTPGGVLTLSPNLTIGIGILTNTISLPTAFAGPVPVLGQVTSPTGNTNNSASQLLSLLLSQGFGRTSSTNGLPSGLPSLTATDQTQIFHYANFDQMPEEEAKEYQLAENGDINGVLALDASFTTAETDRLTKAGVVLAKGTTNVVASNANFLNIDKGNVLFSPNHNIVVGTHEGNVYIASGATVLVMETGHDVAIYDFDQSRPGQVSVVVGNKKMELLPGGMLVLTKQQVNDFEELPIFCRRIGYRRGMQVSAEGTIKVFSANFSPASAVDLVLPIKNMMASSDKAEQNALKKILLSSAILIDLEKSGKPFANEEMAKPAVAAAPFRNGDMMR